MGRLKLVVWIVLFAGFVAGCSMVGSKSNDYYKDGGILFSEDQLQKVLNVENTVVVDVRSKGFKSGHVKGARWLDPTILKADLSSDTASFKKELGKLGIDKDKKVVIYGDTESNELSTRLFFIMESLGLKDVHILNGGWESWTGAGFEVSKESAEVKSVVFNGDLKRENLASTEDVAAALSDKNAVIIDVRDDEAFNGWKVRNVKRGGHIPGALQIPAPWIFDSSNKFIDPSAFGKILRKKGIDKGNRIILYGSNNIETTPLFTALKLSGFNDVSNYEGSVVSWAGNPGMKMEKLKRYEKIVSADWVKDLIDGKRPETFKGGKYVILEARYLSSTTTKANADPEKIAYIPGAVSIHPCYLEHKNNEKKYYPKYTEPKDGNLLPEEELVKAIGELGISKDTMVVVYGSGVIIPMTSARVAWALMYAGVKDVRILNGGYTTWLKKGYEVSDKPSEQVKVDFGADKPMRPELLATMDMVRKIAAGKEKDCVMVDVRREEENIGKLNPYPFFTKTGKIPGAVWMGNWDELVDMNDNTFRSYTEVRDLWKSLGITKDREAIYYCGTGWRSSIGFFTAYVMGFEKMRNYDGSFYEWSWYPENRLGD